VDAVEREGVDIVAQADSIPLDDACAEEVLAVHVVEHVYIWEVPDLFREWYRLLIPGGALILEMPDLMKTCRNVLDGRRVGGKDPDQLTMWSLYGDPRTKDPYMAHKWCHTFKSLSPIVSQAGFIKIAERTTMYHPAGREFRDFRLEARKPGSV
jgi:predicted SAM-dependent methyltransferase